MVLILVILLLFQLEGGFFSFEKRFEKIRKINILFNLKIPMDEIYLKYEKLKEEKNIQEIEKLKEQLENLLNVKLKEKLKEFSESLNGFGGENIEKINDKLIEKLENHFKSLKDPCPTFYQRAESTDKIYKKIDEWCNISKSQCFFSSDLKEYAILKLEEEKLNFFSKIENKNDLKEIDLTFNSLKNCFKEDPSFNEKIANLRNKIFFDLKNNFEKKEYEKFIENLYVYKILDKENGLNYIKDVLLLEISQFCSENLKEKIIGLFPDFEKNLKEECFEKSELKITERKEEKKFFDNENPYIVLDIWQSAWGDFKDLDILISYIKKNKISEINLNIGKEMTEKFETKEKAKEILNKIVPKLYNSGIKKVNLLYAELNYPIGNYASFLNENLDFKIEKIVDDSEFTDKNIEKYLKNSNDVKRYNIKYSVFVTLEKEGNSGVSDNTRFYLIREADEVILMSYFTCSFEEQKRWLSDYLNYAEKIGKEKSIKIALLFGGKSVGRETSCENLGKENLNKLILDLHKWASSFSSYSGIVFETNKKLPPEVF